MKLAFYLAENGTFFDKLIAWWSGLFKGGARFPHVELVIGECDGEPPLCFSSSPRDGGVRTKHIDIYDGHWEIVDVPVLERQYATILMAVNALVNAKGRYDWAGVLGFVAPWGGQDGQRWFCSEVVLFVLQTAGVLPGRRPSGVSPSRLYQLATGMWPGKKGDR
jgi:hypothetical protein